MSEAKDWTWRSDEVERGIVDILEAWAPSTPAGPAVRHALGTILSENARLRSVLGHCPRGIAVLDEHANVVGFNRELQALLGGVPTLGEPMDRFFDPHDREILFEVAASARRGKRSAGVMRVGETERDVEFFAATLPGSEGVPIGIVMAGEDRTAALRDDSERARVDEANTQSAFELALSIVRHEIGGLLHVALDAVDPARLGGDDLETRCRTASEALRQAETILVRRTACVSAMWVAGSGVA